MKPLTNSGVQTIAYNFVSIEKTGGGVRHPLLKSFNRNVGNSMVSKFGV